MPEQYTLSLTNLVLNLVAVTAVPVMFVTVRLLSDIRRELKLINERKGM